MSTPISRLGALGLMLLAASGLGCGDHQPPATPTAPADPAAAGAQIYAMACARCHAADGAGSGQLAARIGPIPPLKSARVAAMSQGDIETIIRSGRGAMPPHAARLDATRIKRAAAHVRRLNGASP